MDQRTSIAPGVWLSRLDADKFCRQRIAISFLWPARRETATAEALLSMVMERSYAGCPDMTQLSKKLARLYGAQLDVDIQLRGANRQLTVAVTGIQDRFALDGENLSRAYAQLALGVAFTPVMNGDTLDPEAVAIEKGQLREQIESEINDKRLYCLRQARRRLLGDAPEGIERWGYLEELEDITAEDVTAAFRHMVRTACIEVVCAGADADAVRDAVLHTLQGVQRAPAALMPFRAVPAAGPGRFAEPLPTVQDKLCLLFTAPRVATGQDLAAMRVAVALLGGTATSRLFQNVREKQSLCYYCAAGYAVTMGMMSIDSGVEHANAAAAEHAILKELEALRTGPITDQELAETKRALINQIAAVGDSMAAREVWWMNEILLGTLLTPDQVSAQIKAVAADDVRQALGQFTLAVTYSITQGGAAE